MRLLSIIFMIIYLNNAVLAIDEDASLWNCTERGPMTTVKNSKEIDQIITSHFFSDEQIKNSTRSNGTYNIDYFTHIVDKRVGDKFRGFPFLCEKKGKKDIKFYDHPFVMNNDTKEINQEATRSETGSHTMKCSLLRAPGHIDATNFTWKWFKKTHGEYDEIDYNNKNYNITVTLSDAGINLHNQLKIKLVSPEDEAMYMCAATNAHGAHEYIFDLHVLGLLSLAMPFLIALILITIFSIAVLTFEKVQLKMKNNPVKA